MQINNQILHDFINCQYKVYKKNKGESGIPSDYQELYHELKQSQINSFSTSLSPKSKLISSDTIFDNTIQMEGASIKLKFANENIDIMLDGVEFTGKNMIPIFITPFEKVTKTDKLFVALQATFIQNEFQQQIENCKIVSGINLKQTKFKLPTFTRVIKKVIGELNKTLSNSNVPVFFKNRHCQVCEFQNSCLEKLIEKDDLSLLTALKQTEIQQKNNRGVFSVKQLSYTFRPKRNPYRKRKFLPALKALAIRENKTFIQEIPIIKEVETEIYLDFEGIIDRGFNYLIGVIIKTKDVETNYSFWANNEKEEAKIFMQFLDVIENMNDFVLYHYGSYEIQALKNISKNLAVKYQEIIKKILNNSVNVLSFFTHNVYPPTYSNSLKEIAKFLKYDWSEKDASGFQSTIWRYNWEITKNYKLKEKLKTYNYEDCVALINVKNWISTLVKKDENQVYTSTLKSDNIFKWGITNYFF